MNLIKLNNVYSYLTLEDKKVFDVIYNNLRFREKNYNFNPRYRNKIWDGYKDFLDKKNGKFLTGLLPEIQYVLNKFEIKYEINDYRNDINFKYDKIKPDFMNDLLSNVSKDMKSKFSGLLDYQVSLTNQVLKHKRGIILAPTGAGKSLIITCILRCLPQEVTALVISPKKGLCFQNHDDIQEWGFDEIGIYNSNKKDIKRITCLTYQSIHNIPKNILNNLGCLIVDEIHLGLTKKTKKYFKLLNNCNIKIGVSATPFKFGEKDKCQKYEVKGHFGPVFKIDSILADNGVITTKKLQEHGIASKSQCFIFPVNEPQLPYELYIDAVEKGIAKNQIFNNMLVELTKVLTGRTLILVERIAHGELLKELMPNIIWVQGKDKMSTKKETVDLLKFSEDDLIVVAVSKLFNEGISFYAHNLINATGGNAEHDIKQRFGRGLRPSKDKNILFYIDFFFNNNDYLKKHSINRLKILKKEGHPIKIFDSFDLNEFLNFSKNLN